MGHNYAYPLQNSHDKQGYNIQKETEKQYIILYKCIHNIEKGIPPTIGLFKE